MSINPLNKIELSPETRAEIAFPLFAEANIILDDDGSQVCRIITGHGTLQVDCELAAFIAALLNAALMPDPASTPESNAEPHQIVTTEYEAAAGLDAEGVSVAERLARR